MIRIALLIVAGLAAITEGFLSRTFDVSHLKTRTGISVAGGDGTATCRTTRDTGAKSHKA